MKIRDVVILVKYAQGAVLFDPFFSYLKFLKSPERKIFLSQIIELIGHFNIDECVVDLAIKQSGLSSNCSAYLMLKEDLNDMRNIIELPESELESSFKLLLTLFSIGYQEGFQKNKNAPDKFWYWDYYEVSSYKLIEMNEMESVQLDEILRP